MTRVLIAGVPRSGKTTHAKRFGDPTFHTDDLIGELEWSAASAEVANWISYPGPWCIEGVAVPRALRKWLAAHPGEKPCDVAYWMPSPHVSLTPGQEAMAKGCVKVWAEVEPELRARGVKIL